MSRKRSYLPTNDVFADQSTKDGPARLLRKLEISAPVEITVVPTVPRLPVQHRWLTLCSESSYPSLPIWFLSVSFLFFFLLGRIARNINRELFAGLRQYNYRCERSYIKPSVAPQ